MIYDYIGLESEEKVAKKDQQNGPNNSNLLHRVLDALLVLPSVQLRLPARVRVPPVRVAHNHLASRSDHRLHELGAQPIHLFVHERGVPNQLPASLGQLQLLLRHELLVNQRRQR